MSQLAEATKWATLPDAERKKAFADVHEYAVRWAQHVLQLLTRPLHVWKSDEHPLTPRHVQVKARAIQTKMKEMLEMNKHTRNGFLRVQTEKKFIVELNRAVKVRMPNKTFDEFIDVLNAVIDPIIAELQRVDAAEAGGGAAAPQTTVVDQATRPLVQRVVGLEKKMDKVEAQVGESNRDLAAVEARVGTLETGGGRARSRSRSPARAHSPPSLRLY